MQERIKEMKKKNLDQSVENLNTVRGMVSPRKRINSQEYNSAVKAQQKPEELYFPSKICSEGFTAPPAHIPCTLSSRQN
jgi:hypothetical protein